MGYLHIDNLYKFPDLSIFGKEGWAMEKIHGTSAHVGFSDGSLKFFSGGENREKFLSLFNHEELEKRLSPYKDITIYGEAYGGKQQKMAATYGPDTRFIAFDVFLDGMWLSVPEAHRICLQVGLEFVHYVQIPITVEALNRERDADSIQAIRNGMGEGKKREGIVLRPLIEGVNQYGERVIGKHKREDFQETKQPRELGAEQQAILVEAALIAEEWVTPMRLQHVLDKLGNPREMNRIPDITKAMVEDVEREGRGEILESKEARKAISGRTVLLFKKLLTERMEGR